MQGRLSKPHKEQIQSFPNQSWKEEFEIASNCGLEIIEWIFDEIQPNPILSDEGIIEINQLMEKKRIFLFGNNNDFERLGKERLAEKT